MTHRILLIAMVLVTFGGNGLAETPPSIEKAVRFKATDVSDSVASTTPSTASPDGDRIRSHVLSSRLDASTQRTELGSFQWNSNAGQIQELGGFSFNSCSK